MRWLVAMVASLSSTGCCLATCHDGVTIRHTIEPEITQLLVLDVEVCRQDVCSEGTISSGQTLRQHESLEGELPGSLVLDTTTTPTLLEARIGEVGEGNDSYTLRAVTPEQNFVIELEFNHVDYEEFSVCSTTCESALLEL